MNSVVLEEGDPECRIYYVDGYQRKQNETLKNVVQLCAKLITEVMENRDDFSPQCISIAFFTFSVGRMLAKDLYQIFSLGSAVGKQSQLCLIG